MLPLQVELAPRMRSTRHNFALRGDCIDAPATGGRADLHQHTMEAVYEPMHVLASPCHSVLLIVYVSARCVGARRTACMRVCLWLVRVALSTGQGLRT